MAYLFAVLENLLHAPQEPVPQRPVPQRQSSPPPGTPALSPSPPLAEVAVPEGGEQHPIWRAVLEEFSETMTPVNAARCARAHVVDQEGTVLRLAVPDTFHLHWLERLHGRIEKTLDMLGHTGVQVAFQVVAQDI